MLSSAVRTTLAASLAALAAAAGAASSSASTATEAAEPGAIVYSSGQSGRAEIYVRSADGSIQRVTRNRVYDGFPAWSPDRTEIAFVSDRGGDADIYVMRADGTGVRRLTGGNRPGRGAYDLYPAWSPDGRLIAFSSNRAAIESEIFVMRSDGSAVRRLTRTATYTDDVQPRFSPDGRYIVFTSNRINYWNYEIFRMRASDGRGLKRLTFWGNGRTGGRDGAPGDDLLPTYSPDGKRIAFFSDRRGGYAVWTMNPDGSGLR